MTVIKIQSHIAYTIGFILLATMLVGLLATILNLTAGVGLVGFGIFAYLFLAIGWILEEIDWEEERVYVGFRYIFG